jgi:hypothetical protein
MRDLLRPGSLYFVRQSFDQVLLVDELASARRGNQVASMNCVMTIGTSPKQRQTGAVVVRRVTLQAQSGLADYQQILVRRSVRRVTLHAVFGHGRMLERERPLILGMALEAKLVAARRVQTIPRAAAMRIMAVDAGHLAFANRVMVGKIGLGLLLLVALQAFGVR